MRPIIEWELSIDSLTSFIGECISKLLFNCGRTPTRQEIDLYETLKRRKVKLRLQLFDNGNSNRGAKGDS